MEDIKLMTAEEEVVNTHSYDEESLDQLWKKTSSAHKKKDKVFKVINAVDNGEQWSISNKKIRKGQKLASSNVLSAIRDTRLGALNIEGFIGEFISETEEMDPIVPAINDYFGYFWRKGNYDKQVLSAIEAGLTFGTGATLVTARHQTPVHGGKEWTIVDNLVLTNIDPMNIYPDPAAKSEEDATFFFIKDVATINHLRIYPQFKDKIKENYSQISQFVENSNVGTESFYSDLQTNDTDSKEADYLIYIGKTILSDGQPRWDMVYMFGGIILHKIEGITPNKNPLVFFREKRDKKSFWGQSSFKQNLPLQLAVNELDSVMLTNAAKQGDPIAFIKATSGLNVADFLKNKDQPGRGFVYSGGSPTDVVSYLQQPDLPRDISTLPSEFIARMKDVTGVDDMYSGAGTGSLQTSGGISQVLQRSGLRDVKIIKHIEDYLRDLYLLILEHVKISKTTARYAKKIHSDEETSYNILPLDQVQWDHISLVIKASNHTGGAQENNKLVIDTLFQQSVQYAAAQPLSEPLIMTADEYLAGIKDKNLHKLIDKITERRKHERELDMAQKVSEIIQIYLQLVSQGENPQEAIVMVSQEYASDAGILKGFTLADLAKQQQSSNGAGGQQGQNKEASK